MNESKHQNKSTITMKQINNIFTATKIKKDFIDDDIKVFSLKEKTEKVKIITGF
jgi:hypothetical protein